MIIAEIPNLNSLNNLTGEQAQGMILILSVLEDLYHKGIKEITRADLLHMLGFESEETDNVVIGLTGKYFEEKEHIWTILHSKVALKH